MASLHLRIKWVMKFISILPILFYQKFLRHTHNRECIYKPTCSNYTIGAIWKYGPLLGWKYGLLRIKRCNGSLYMGGLDEP